MNDWKAVIVNERTLIRDSIVHIDKHEAQVALVADEDFRLIGTVTDGDVRRGMLAGVTDSAPVSMIMNRKPITARPSVERADLIHLMKSRQVLQVPIVDVEGRLMGLETLRELSENRLHDNVVVLMAGGIGQRLRPLTADLPKPMLQVGNRPILETILIRFREHGFRRFQISVNYKSDLIREHFGDGSTWGAEIQYLQESNPLGTAGALRLMPEKPDLPFIVMNADVLTKINLNFLLEFHLASNAIATMCVREYNFNVPYGVVRLDRNTITGLEEKPRQSLLVNAGIYVLDPEVLDMLPPTQSLDMPELFQSLLRSKFQAAAFPIREYWLDIGQPSDLSRAVDEFEVEFR